MTYDQTITCLSYGSSDHNFDQVIQWSHGRTIMRSHRLDAITLIENAMTSIGDAMTLVGGHQIINWKRRSGWNAWDGGRV